MNIKTITCHHVYNPGASLQAYALITFLKNLGHNVEIIDYRPNYLCDEYRFLSVTNDRFRKSIVHRCIYILAKLPSKLYFLGRKYSFDRFEKKYLNLTKLQYNSDKQLKAICPVADVYIAGSDQIWNSMLPNGRDPTFYLNFVPKTKICIAYAASFGTNRISDSLIPFYKQMLSNFDFISVREGGAIALVQSLGYPAFNVCDPVLLLSRQQWTRIEEHTSNENSPYVFVYDFDGNDCIASIAKNIAQKRSLKIFSMFKSDYADRCFYTSGPIDFISLIHGAEYVLTNSFHAMVFSVIFEKPFLVARRRENINSRLLDFLSAINLEHRCVTSSDVDFDAAIAYDEVKDKIETIIAFSKKFLYNHINIKDNNQLSSIS